MDDSLTEVKAKRTFEQDLIDQQEKDRLEAIEKERERLRQEGEQKQKELQAQEDRNQKKDWTKIESYTDEEGNEESEEPQEQDSLVEEEFGYEEDGEDGKKNAPSGKPSFPFVFILVSLIKDIIDIIMAVTGVGEVFALLYNPFYDAVFFFWRRKRISKLKISEAKKRMLESKTFTRMLAMFGIEELPFIDIIPMSTIAVYLQYKTEIDEWKNKK